MATVRKTLTGEQKNVVVQLYKENMKQTEIARLFDANRSTMIPSAASFDVMKFAATSKTGREADDPSC